MANVSLEYGKIDFLWRNLLIPMFFLPSFFKVTYTQGLVSAFVVAPKANLELESSPIIV
jgi:hypothetical protein